MSLIVIEGLDGSGKNTQAKLLTKFLNESGRRAEMLSFPEYESDSSALVRMYLSGKFGTNPDAVNPYAASAFYAVDRIASYLARWKAAYADGMFFVADRYTTSNILFQLTKLPETEWAGFIAWVEDLEYDKFGLPKPDKVIYLDVQPATSKELLERRYHDDETKKDIHERDLAFLARCRAGAGYIVAEHNWTVIDCVRDGAIRPPEEIHEDVVLAIRNLL